MDIFLLLLVTTLPVITAMNGRIKNITEISNTTKPGHWSDTDTLNTTKPGHWSDTDTLNTTKPGHWSDTDTLNTTKPGHWSDTDTLNTTKPGHWSDTDTLNTTKPGHWSDTDTLNTTKPGHWSDTDTLNTTKPGHWSDTDTLNTTKPGHWSDTDTLNTTKPGHWSDTDTFNTTKPGHWSDTDTFNTTKPGHWSDTDTLNTTKPGHWSDTDTLNTTKPGHWSDTDTLNTTKPGHWSDTDTLNTTKPGHWSDTDTLNTTNTDGYGVWFWVLVILGPLVCLAVVAAIVIHLKSRKRKKDQLALDVDEQTVLQTNVAVDIPSTMPEATAPAFKSYKELTIEYAAMKTFKPDRLITKAYDKHPEKNRYNDIVCADATRVVLKERDDDYIHSSWMTMPDSIRYIGAQGPISSTIIDFWMMVIQENSNVIVMLCNVIEGGVEKCSSYFPSATGEKAIYGPLTVTLKEKKTDPFENIQHQVLQVEYKGVVHILNHLWHTGWPDRSVPANINPVISLNRLAKVLAAGSVITVHCSAGIGRTATFVGIDLAAQRISKDPNASMANIVKVLRCMRLHAIQSPIQYVFLHMSVLEIMVQSGVIPRDQAFLKFEDIFKMAVSKTNAKLVAIASHV